MAVVATVGLLAGWLSWMIYEELIIPRLSSIRSVPMAWWGGMFLPWGAAAVVTGYLSRTILRVLTAAVLLVAPWFFVRTWIVVQRGKPFDHDVWVGESGYWSDLATRVIFAAITIGSVSAAVRIRARYTRHDEPPQPL